MTIGFLIMPDLSLLRDGGKPAESLVTNQIHFLRQGGKGREISNRPVPEMDPELCCYTQHKKGGKNV